MALRTLINGDREAYFLRRRSVPISAPLPDAPTPAPDSVTADSLATKIQPPAYLTDPVRVPYTYPYTPEEKAELQSQIAQPQICPPVCPAGYSAPGVLLPGWTQPQCITFPCPAIYMGEGGKDIVDWFEIPGANGDTVIVGTDDAGDVVAATPKPKPNLLPLALAAGAAYFFLM